MKNFDSISFRNFLIIFDEKQEVKRSKNRLELSNSSEKKVIMDTPHLKLLCFWIKLQNGTSGFSINIFFNK
jgi:hypothetical protein